jgi:hypothetical protein
MASFRSIRRQSRRMLNKGTKGQTEVNSWL